MTRTSRRQRRGHRRGGFSTATRVHGLKTRKSTSTTAMLGMGLVVVLHNAPVVRTNAAAMSDPSQSTTIVTVDENDYCGKTWQDAYTTCPLACPNGKDTDCAELGEEYSCQSFTLCRENLASGKVQSQAGGADPTPEPTPAAMISFPECPVEYSPGVGYAYGSMVAHSPLVSGGSTADAKMVYSCRANNSACDEIPPGVGWMTVGSCPSSSASPGGAASASSSSPPAPITNAPTPTPPPPVDKWWLYGGDDFVGCVFGSDYPPIYATDETLREQYVFDSEEECCASTGACGDGGDGDGDDGNNNATANDATKEPTESPSAMPTMFPSTYMPTTESGASWVRGRSFLLCFATVYAVHFL